jgi:dCMP deaminase
LAAPSSVNVIAEVPSDDTSTSEDENRVEIIFEEEPNNNVIKFEDVTQLIAYVTPRWREHFVLTDIREKQILDELSTRPFFILISVDAPVTIRWKRYMER